MRGYRAVAFESRALPVAAPSRVSSRSRNLDAGGTTTLITTAADMISRMGTEQRAVRFESTEAPYKGLQELAVINGMSINELTQDELRAILDREKSQRLSEAFKKLAEKGSDYNNVDGLLPLAVEAFGD